MNQQATFEGFVQALSTQLGTSLDPAPGALQVDLNGTPFLIAHDPEQWGDENVMFACDFGPAPERDRAEIYAALLAANRDLHGLWSPVFTMNPDTGHVVSMLALPLDGLDPGNAMEMMIKHVAVAQRWQQDHFLVPEEA
ncbi:CesT family type III secretion system chaperone [Massilia oculi]|uniref:Uncharacterized protein n=1 Tax=Massilia oculi TaxID=945844 RepID=A0A2S2DDV2_9BURK|nr:CesT family type III secretion system chaperone [Massilia oculi]AWL03522.1 hypothetical protein DIR46_03035 [Massilia oculi]